ncbi:MAG: hypothetical protein SFW08_08650 [Gemmatimonadaceae bacterium]|nr:hypothetical protein [Gemmatimonadaceae bacterium]
MTRQVRPARRSGFVVPTVLVIAVMLSAAVAGAYSYLNSERRTNDNRRAEIEAVAVANAGLQKFLIDFFRDPATFPAAKRDSMMPSNWVGISVAADSSVTVTLALDVSNHDDRRRVGGVRVSDTAEVKAYLIRRPASVNDSSLWLIRSRGIPARKRAVGELQAERVVTAYTWIAPGNMNVMGGWVSLTGINRNGAAGTLSGQDECAQNGTIWAAVAPSDIANGYSGSMAGVVGGVDESRNAATLTSTLNINWALVAGGSSPIPDFVLTQTNQSLPPAACARFAVDTSYYPTILVRNGNPPLFPGPGWQYDYTSLCPSLSNSVIRRGLLIVQGDFRTQGSSGGNFGGIVLVGEQFTANGNQTMTGAIVSGLRKTVDTAYAAASEVATLNGNKTYQYNSCRVKAALQQLRGLRPMLNTWTDGWTASP